MHRAAGAKTQALLDYELKERQPRRRRLGTELGADRVHQDREARRTRDDGLLVVREILEQLRAREPIERDEVPAQRRGRGRRGDQGVVACVSPPLLLSSLRDKNAAV